MSYNKSLFMQMRKESKQKKTQPKPKDRIVDPMGQWNHPGEITRIPSNRITMQGVSYPVLGVGSNGQQQMMFPGQEYAFPGSQYVDEYPMMKAQNGGTSDPQERAKKAKDFLTNMYNSSLFGERYAAMTGRDLKDIDAKEIEQYKNTLLNNLNTVYAAPFGEEPKKGEFYTGDDMSFPNLIGGVYYENPPEEGKPGHSVWLNKYFADQPTTTHEWSHASTRSNKNLPFTPKIPFNYDPSLAGYAQAQFADENRKKYLTDPTEIKGRKDAVAQFLQEQGVWDPTTERFGKKQYDYLKNLEKEVEYKLDNELQVDDRLLELLSQWQEISLPYKEENTYRIFNEIVKSNNNNYLTFAQNGGEPIPFDYKRFEKFYETLPNNLKDPNYKYGDYSRYDLYGMWNASRKPNSFTDVKDTELFPLHEDGTYHGFSVGNDGIWLKPKGHKSAWMEYYYGSLSPELKNKTVIQREDGRLQWVDKKQKGGDISIPNLEKGNWLNRYDEGGLTTDETTIPAYLRGPMRGDIQGRGMSVPIKQIAQSQIKEEQAISNIQKQTGVNRPIAQLIRQQQKQPISKTTIGPDTRTDYQRKIAAQKVEDLNRYREQVLGIPQGTTQADIDRNRAQNEKLLNAIEVGTLLEAPFSLGAKTLARALPDAFVPLEGMMYRGIGKEGFEDAITSGVFRPKQYGYSPGRSIAEKITTPKQYGRTYYAPSEKFGVVKNYGPEYVVEVPFEGNQFGRRYSKRNNWSWSTPKEIPIGEGRILKKDWLRGYKEVNVPKSTSTFESEIDLVSPPLKSGFGINNLYNDYKKTISDFVKSISEEKDLKKLAFKEISSFKTSPFYSRLKTYHNKNIQKFGESYPSQYGVTYNPDRILKQAQKYVNQGRYEEAINILKNGKNAVLTPKELFKQNIPTIKALSYLGATGAAGASAYNAIPEAIDKTISLLPRPIQYKLARSYGFNLTNIPKGLHKDPIEIDLTDKNLTFAKSGDVVEGSTILGGDFIENSANNTVRKAKDWLTTKADDTYSDQNYLTKDIQSFYGVEDGKFKVGKANEFKPDTEIVPNRFDKGQLISKAKIADSGYFRLLDNNNNPIYHNVQDSGKFILYSPSTKKAKFYYIDSAKQGVNYVNNFLKENKDAKFIILDNGRYEFYGANPKGLTKEDFNDYYDQDFSIPSGLGYNLIVKKHGGQFNLLNRYQDGGEKPLNPKGKERGVHLGPSGLWEWRNYKYFPDKDPNTGKEQGWTKDLKEVKVYGTPKAKPEDLDGEFRYTGMGYDVQFDDQGNPRLVSKPGKIEFVKNQNNRKNQMVWAENASQAQPQYTKVPIGIDYEDIRRRGDIATQTGTGSERLWNQFVGSQNISNKKFEEGVSALMANGMSQEDAIRQYRNYKENPESYKYTAQTINDYQDRNYRIKNHPDYDPSKPLDQQASLAFDNSIRARLLRGSNMLTNSDNPLLNLATGIITSPARSLVNLTTNAQQSYFNPNNSFLQNATNLAFDLADVIPFPVAQGLSAAGRGTKNVLNKTGIPHWLTGYKPVSTSIARNTDDASKSLFSNVTSNTSSTKPFVFNQGRFNEAKGFLDRYQHLKKLQAEGLIAADADILKYARSGEGVNDITRRAIERANTRYRGVYPDLREYDRTGQSHGYGIELNEDNINRIMENMQNAGVDINDPVAIGEYMATHIPSETIGYRSGASGLPAGWDAIFTSTWPYREYGSHKYELKLPFDFSKGNYKDWLTEFNKPKKSYNEIATQRFPSSMGWEERQNVIRSQIFPGMPNIKNDFIGPRGFKVFKSPRLLSADEVIQLEGKGLPLPKKLGGQTNWLNRYQGGGSFPSFGKIIQNTKKSLNTWLGDPYEKAHQFAEIFGGPDNDEIDNARHAMAGNLTAQGIQNKFPNWMKYTGVPQLTGFLGSNVLGMGHEFSTLFDPKDKRSFLVKMRELGEDGVNNFVGSVIGSTSLSPSEKQKWIEYLSANNLLPDGYGEADANMYFKKQTGGSISLNKEYFPGKGWAYILPEVVIKSKKIKNNQYNIPIDNTQVASNLSAIQELKEFEQFQKQNPHLSPFALMTLFRNQRASKQYLNQDYRTDYERQQAIKKIQAENNYREKVLGISKGTTQVERDKNRKKNEKLLNALEVAMAAEGGFSLLKPSISKVTTNLVQNTTSPNALRSIINPLGIVDEVAPMLPNPIKLLTFGAPVGNTGPMTLSPLNLIPGYGKVLGRPGTAYRKFGNTMDHVITTKTLSPKGGSPLRLGKNQITNEGNWAELDAPNENYPGVFAAEFDFNNPGTNLGYVNPSNRNGVLITTNTGKKLVDIPIKDQGVDFYRRLPFSNRYMPIDKQKILNNEFQWATQGGYLQSLAEKYGMAYVYASGLAAMGNKKPLELLQKYTLDPKTFKENLKEMGLTEQYKKGGQTNWLDAYDDSEQLQQFDPGGTTRFATTFTTTSKSTANQQLQYLNYWANQSKSNNQNGSILNRPQQTSTGIMTTDDLYRAAGINFNQKPQVVIQPGYVAGNTTKEGAIQINKVHKVSQPGMTYQQKVNQVKANDQKKKDDERRAKEEQERQIKEREAAAATRAKVIGGNNNAIFTFPDGTTKAWKDMDWREQAYVSGKNLGSWNNNNWTDWINPLAMLGSLSEGIGTSPYVARKTNSYMPYITGFGIPLLTGALAGIGTNTTSQFANNLVNPFAGLENVAQQYLNKGKQLFRNTSSKPIIQTADEFPEKLELQLSDEDFARMNREIDEAMADPKNKEAFDDIQGTLDNAEMTAEEYKQKLRDDQARQYSYDLDNYNTYYKRGYGDMVEDKFITEDYVKNFNKNFRNDLSAQRKYIGKTKKEIIDDFIEQTEKLGKNPNDVDPDGFIRGLMGYPGFTPIDWKPSPLGFQIYDPESMMQSQKQISNWPINLGGREIKPNENFIRVYDKSKGMVDWPNILQKGFYIKNKKGGEVNWLNKYT